MKKLNQGGKTMKATFCATKNGNGYKIAVNDEWLYTSKENLLKVLIGLDSSCQFSTFEEDKE